MIDMIKTIEAKSTQLNSDDLMAAPITVRITKVSAGNSEQPIAINYEGDNGKPFYPCKSMRRVIVAVWGVNAASYVGRSMTLYRDPEVKFGGIAVGGIRISHMTGIDKPIVMALTATRASKKPYTVKPLVVAAPDYTATKVLLQVAASEGLEEFKQAWLGLDDSAQAALFEYKEELKQQLTKENK